MNPRHLVLFVMLAWSPYLFGALQTWDLATFEASPANSDQVSQGDDKIRELKENIRDRAEVEHLWGTISTGGDNGRSREGNARVFYDNSEPSALSNSVTDTAGSGALDEGRLWRDANDGDLKVYSGSAWVQAFTTLRGTVNFLDTPRFATTAGADAYNPLLFAIRNIIEDDVLDVAACGTGLSSTDLVDQTFGDAGAACLSISPNFSSRSDTTRGLVILTATFESVTTGCRLAVYLDATDTSAQLAPIARVDNEDISTTVVAYVENISAASHEIAVHGETTGTTGDCDPYAAPNGMSLLFVDLGPEY